MHSASDDLSVQPADVSWKKLTEKLDHHRVPHPVSPIYRMSMILVRIAAVLLIVAAFWWVIDGQSRTTPVFTEFVNDNPAYFASYLDVAQSLQDQMTSVEGPGHAGFKESYPNLPASGDSAGSL